MSSDDPAPASKASSDDTTAVSDDSQDTNDESAEEPVEEMATPVNNSTDEPVDNASDYSKKTREELAELDDLDI